MTKIIKNGSNAVYIHKCVKCYTVFSYQYLDTYEENEVDRPIEEETRQKENLNCYCAPTFGLNTAMNGYNVNDNIDQHMINMQFQIKQQLHMQAIQSMVNSYVPPYPRTVFKTKKKDTVSAIHVQRKMK